MPSVDRSREFSAIIFPSASFSCNFQFRRDAMVSPRLDPSLRFLSYAHRAADLPQAAGVPIVYFVCTARGTALLEGPAQGGSAGRITTTRRLAAIRHGQKRSRAGMFIARGSS